MESTFLDAAVKSLVEKLFLEKFFLLDNTHYISLCGHCADTFNYRAVPDNYRENLKQQIKKIFYSQKSYPLWLRDHIYHTSSYCCLPCWEKQLKVLNNKVAEEQKLEWFFIKLL